MPRHADATTTPTGSPAPLVPRWLMIALAQVIALAIAASMIHVPLHSISPGRTTNILGEIDVKGGRTYPSEGQLLLTTASVSQLPLTVWEALYVWIDPGIATIPRPFLVPPASNDDEQDVQNRHDIEQSKIVAAVAAFRSLGFDVPIVRGAGVVTVLDGTPADGELKTHDRIVKVDGVPIGDADRFSRVVGARQPGAPVTLTVFRGGNRRTVRLKTAGADGHAFVGVTLGPVYRFPDDVRIDTGPVVGPSGGLVFALSIANVFTEQDLTAGRIIGVTGTIALDDKGRGVVGPIGAVGEKVRGAARDGATVFIVPKDEEAEARGFAPSGMEIIGVRTLDQAVRALRALEPLPEQG